MLQEQNEDDHNFYSFSHYKNTPFSPINIILHGPYFIWVTDPAVFGVPQVVFVPQGGKSICEGATVENKSPAENN